MDSVAVTDKLYIVISQTGTVLSRFLRLLTGAKYNHVSIGLYENLDKMYSFGRLNPYNPFYGGFVIESPYSGTFKRFKNTDVVILSIDVDSELHNEICKRISYMSAQRKKYHYNYFGLLFAFFNIAVKCDNRYYCSEFVRDLLIEYHISGADRMNKVVQPIHFLEIPADFVYSGKLRDYATKKNDA